jgi:hypothetical protein
LAAIDFNCVIAEKSDVNDEAETLAVAVVEVDPAAVVFVVVDFVLLLQPTSPINVVAAVAASAARFSETCITGSLP